VRGRGRGERAETEMVFSSSGSISVKKPTRKSIKNLKIKKIAEGTKISSE
jgi:hypothetical protein